MVPGSDKWIRSLKENSTGKVVAEGGTNRWEWQSDDETSRQLKKLHNEALSIERTDLRPPLKPGTKVARAAKHAKPLGAALKPSRDEGGGFNPYDHPGKTKKR